MDLMKIVVSQDAEESLLKVLAMVAFVARMIGASTLEIKIPDAVSDMENI